MRFLHFFYFGKNYDFLRFFPRNFWIFAGKNWTMKKVLVVAPRTKNFVHFCTFWSTKCLSLCKNEKFSLKKAFEAP